MNFITERACIELELKYEPTNISLSGISQSVTNIRKETKLQIRSRTNNYKTKIEYFVLAKTTSQLPTTTISLETFKIPFRIKLADPDFHESKAIDLIIGASRFWTLLSVEQIKLTDPTLQKT